MTAYRVVEAALDDALRGRPGTVASLQVRWSPAALEITVADDRPSVPFAVNAGTGGAPPGVAERVALYGGQLRAGQCSDGGHEVHVRFPLDDAPPTTPPDSDPVAAQGAA
jgi:glucose-6-phosphate-specific signal transduction histidine kinase